MSNTGAEWRKLLDPAVLTQVGHLDVLSRTVVDGLLAGRHRSIQRGGTFEFAEHRAYSAGDELRLIDWRIYGKRDRYYIKQFEEEINLQATMVVDASGSMEFGMSTPTKLAYAKCACACLSRLMLRQRDAVGLQCFSGKKDFFIPPRSRASHLHALLETLHGIQPTGNKPLSAVLSSLGRRLKRRGMIVVFSDCFDDQEGLIKSLRLLRLRGHQVILFHVLAPEELSFTFSNTSRFVCLESAGVKLDLEPAAIRQTYLARMNAFLTKLMFECARIRCEYFRLTTDQSLADTLSYYLRLRAASLN
ncbi:MAG: DUF58 domain-containing protein [Planctomycetaceae bacterium]